MARTRARSQKTQKRRKAGVQDPEAALRGRLRAIERGTLRHGFASSRDALAAMAVVRAIERASRMVAEEGGSRALKKALAAAEKPLAEYIAHEAAKGRPRRKKA